MKKGGQECAVGQRCYGCAMIAQLSFPALEWQTLVAKAKSQPSFAQELKATKARWADASRLGPVAVPFLQEHLADRSVTGYQVQRTLMMVTSSEFESKYGMKAGEVAGLQWHDVLDECGVPVRAIFLEHPFQKFRTITFSTETGFHLDTTVAPASDMLRPNQNRDLMRHLLKSGSHQTPDTSGMTVEKLEHMVSEQQLKKSEAAAAAAANQPAPLAVSEAQRDAASEMDGMVVDLVAPTVAAMALAGERATLTGGVASKNSGKSNGGGRKAKPAGETGMPSQPPAKRSKPAAAGDAASVVSGKTSVGKSQRKVQEQKDRWQGQLDVCKAMQGVSMKNALYQAKRTLDMIADHSATDYIELQDAREAVLAAEQLANLSPLSPVDRTSLLEHVTGYYDGPLPCQFQVNLLLQVLRENPLVSKEDVEKWIDMCVPGCQQGFRIMMEHV